MTPRGYSDNPKTRRQWLFPKSEWKHYEGHNGLGLERELPAWCYPSGQKRGNVVGIWTGGGPISRYPQLLLY
uniref:Uncharacterized protein n=1 Tax=Picea sitchensis TaxID=3332 RepID=A0A6B9XWB9_PICSI|nr:hypothetical protein Q903MT_gene5647 [Picea sitchensis]